VKVIRWRTEYLLPPQRCGCGTATIAVLIVDLSGRVAAG
jgi:hypothetical protein